MAVTREEFEQEITKMKELTKETFNITKNEMEERFTAEIAKVKTEMKAEVSTVVLDRFAKADEAFNLEVKARIERQEQTATELHQQFKLTNDRITEDAQKTQHDTSVLVEELSLKLSTVTTEGIQAAAVAMKRHHSPLPVRLLYRDFLMHGTPPCWMPSVASMVSWPVRIVSWKTAASTMPAWRSNERLSSGPITYTC